MSRKSHTIKELKALKILLGEKLLEVKKVDENVCMISEQIDKPDFGFVMKGERIGIEVCSIDNSKLLESIRTHRLFKPNKAKNKKNTAVSEGRPYTSVYQTTNVKECAWGEILLKKFKLYTGYKDFERVILLLHVESYCNIDLSEAARFHLNNFCIKYACPFDKVFLVDLRHKKYIGEVFDIESKERLVIPEKWGILEGETMIHSYSPVGQCFNIYKKYK